jgi:AraC-like DNA-binding protein/quercetin dioxygenase-like cupin family protein
MELLHLLSGRVCISSGKLWLCQDGKEGTAITIVREETPPERLTSESWLASGGGEGSPMRIFYMTLESRVEVHWHEFYEMSLIAAGEGTHVLNGVAFPLRPGSIFLLTPADFHELVPHTGSRLELYNLIFSEEALSEQLYDALFVKTRAYTASLSGPALEGTESEFRRIQLETRERRPGYGFVVRGALERIMVDLFRNSRGAGSTTRTEAISRHPGLRRALIYLNHHFREPLTLAGVAGQAHLSANYFSERFRKSTGSTFQSYLQGLRLRFARSLLSASLLPVSEVCRASGFNSLPHFERAFKQKFGCTPGSCRRNGR